MTNSIISNATSNMGGIQSIEGGVSNTPFSFGQYAPIIGVGKGIYSAFQGDGVGALSSGIGVLGGLIGGPVGWGLTAASLLGGTFGSSIMGGGRSVRPGFSGINTDSFFDTYLEGVNIEGSQEVSGRSYRQGATALEGYLQFVVPAIDREVNWLRSLGHPELATDLNNELNRLTDADNPPSSQADHRKRQQQLSSILGTAIRLRENMFITASNDPEFRAGFKDKTGISIDDFIGEIHRQDDAYRAGLDLPGANKSLASRKRTQSLLGRSAKNSAVKSKMAPKELQSRIAEATGSFRPVLGSRKRKGVPRKIVGYQEWTKSRGRGDRPRPTGNMISVGEFNVLQQKVTDDFNQEKYGDVLTQIKNINTLVNADGLDIKDALPHFGDLFSTSVENAPPVDNSQPPVEDTTQPPDDGVSDDGISGGVNDDPFSQESIDYFNQQEEALTKLITKQQQDKAMQGDENATDDDRRHSALGLLGATASFLIDSLKNPDEQNRVSRQRDISLGGGGGSFSLGGGSSLQRDVNVLKSPGFNFQSQGLSDRSDIPLERMESSPSSFPILAQIGQGGLVPQPQQNRGLIA